MTVTKTPDQFVWSWYNIYFNRWLLAKIFTKCKKKYVLKHTAKARDIHGNHKRESTLYLQASGTPVCQTWDGQHNHNLHTTSSDMPKLTTDWGEPRAIRGKEIAGKHKTKKNTKSRVTRRDATLTLPAPRHRRRRRRAVLAAPSLPRRPRHHRHSTMAASRQRRRR